MSNKSYSRKLFSVNFYFFMEQHFNICGFSHSRLPDSQTYLSTWTFKKSSFACQNFLMPSEVSKSAASLSWLRVSEIEGKKCFFSMPSAANRAVMKYYIIKNENNIFFPLKKKYMTKKISEGIKSMTGNCVTFVTCDIFLLLHFNFILFFNKPQIECLLWYLEQSNIIKQATDSQWQRIKQWRKSKLVS